MSLSVIKFYNQEFISQLGSEYICTGFMYDNVDMSAIPLAQLQEGWDFGGVVEGEVEEYFYEGSMTENAPVPDSMTTGQKY